MTNRTIILTQDGDSNYWTVQECNRFSGFLGWDEMLGHIAALTLPSRASTTTGLYGMQTPEEMAEHSMRTSRQRRHPAACDLPPVAVDALEQLVREWGCREGEDDSLRPAHSQPNARVRFAMQLLQAIRTARTATALPAPSITA